MWWEVVRKVTGNVGSGECGDQGTWRVAGTYRK